MKMYHLQQIESSIPKLINTDLPIKYAYKLNLVLDDIHKYLGKLQEFRMDYFKKHGEMLDENRVKLPKEKVEEFDEGLAELLHEDVNVEPIEIPLSLVIDSELKLTVLEVESLKNAGFLIDDINTSED